jgi:multiple sugar transport system permease protein
MGYAAAVAWVLFAIVLSVTLVQWQIQKRWVHHE